MVKDFFITKFILDKRKNINQKTKDTVINNNDSFTLNLNKKNASLLVVTLAYVTRCLYYGKVEDIRFENYYGDERFDDIFYQLRTMMFLLNEKCKANFEEYKEYKIIK